MVLQWSEFGSSSQRHCGKVDYAWAYLTCTLLPPVSPASRRSLAATGQQHALLILTATKRDHILLAASKLHSWPADGEPQGCEDKLQQMFLDLPALQLVVESSPRLALMCSVDDAARAVPGGAAPGERERR